MRNDPRRVSKAQSGEDSASEQEPTFAWEFVNDGPASSSTLPGGVEPEGGEASRDASFRRRVARRVNDVRPVGGQFGTARANYVREQLDHALEDWWAAGELPPMRLLRDGLLMLEGDGAAAESQRTLLLRAALFYDRGIQTALRHQVDAERVALVLAEALIEWEIPIEPERLPTILHDEDQVQGLLATELERRRILLTGVARLRADDALAELPRSSPQPTKPMPTGMATQGNISIRRRPLLRQLLLVLLLVAIVGFVMWRQREEKPKGMVAMPAATYALYVINDSGLDAGLIGVDIDAFFIDQFEVTNRDYRACIEAGACKWPLVPHSATRTDYFTNPAFDGYPVVNVTQPMAAQYCAWQEKRLPTAHEWQAAASVSPTTGQAFRYPWGETFDPQRVNSAHSGLGDSVVVGAFRPSGDSPSGVSDIAGNVAEWTASVIAEGQPEARAIVKGGSFADEGTALLVGAEIQLALTRAEPTIGFRCARSHLLKDS